MSNLRNQVVAFPIPSEALEQIEHSIRVMVKDAGEPAVWDRYANPDYDPNLEGWPPTIEVFREWYRRHSGIIQVMKAAEPQLRTAEWDRSEESVALISRALNALIEHTGRAFDDFGKLLEWAIVAWEHDPVIQNMSSEDAEYDEETGDTPITEGIINESD